MQGIGQPRIPDSVTQEGLEKLWTAVQALSTARRDRNISYDKPTTHAKYWNAKQQLVETVMEVFGEDWGDAASKERTGK